MDYVCVFWFFAGQSLFYLLHTLCHEYAVSSVTILPRFYYPNCIFNVLCIFGKLLEFFWIASLNKKGHRNDRINILFDVVVVSCQILEESIFISKHEIVRKMVVSAFGLLERHWYSCLFALCEIDVQSFLEFIVKEMWS